MSGDDLDLSMVSFLVAESDKNFRQIVCSVLRGFGVGTILEAEESDEAMSILASDSLDFLLCDSHMPGMNGFDMVKTVRNDPESPSRYTPIIVMMSHTPLNHVQRARDCGANLVVAKPFSPVVLYNRFAWVARDERAFISAPGYIGPDRRFKIEGYPDGVGRRAEDQDTDIGDEEGPAMSQDEIDALFS